MDAHLVMLLDGYRERDGHPSRYEALEHAIASLRDQDLENACAAAIDE